MAKRVPRRTPGEEADFDRRTQEGLEYLGRLHERVERLEAEQARREGRRRRLRRPLTLGLSS
jgi:hypothetical protein